MDNLAYKEPPRVELIEGKTYLMSPRPKLMHNRICVRIAHIFESYLEGKRCVALGDGADVYLDDKNHYVPDAMIVCNRSILHDDAVYGSPDLVVEVLSPSTAKNDRGPKMRHYAEAGVKEYWIIDPKAENITVYLLKDGKYELQEVYHNYTEEEWEGLDEEEMEQERLKEDIKVSLYDDLIIPVKDIFADLAR